MTSPLSTVTESQDRLLEQKKKFTRKKLRDRLLRNSRKLDNLEGEIISQSRDLLKDLDNKVRDRITSFADADKLSRGNINQSIDKSVDSFLKKRNELSEKAIRKSIRTSNEFRQDMAGLTGDKAKRVKLTKKDVEKLVKDAKARNAKSAEKMRGRLKLNVTQGTAEGKTPTQIAQDMVKDRVVTPERKKGDPSRRGAYAAESGNVADDVRSAFNTSLQKGAEQDKVPGMKKAWLDQDDRKVRPDHVDAGARYAVGGKPGPIPMKQLFTVGGEKAQAPRDARLSGKQRKNCRCYVIHIKPELDELIDKRGAKKKPKK